ncbi:MAG: hypothetical protein IKN55_09600 [Oscillospiraceae bacterium]|nr:hypothetical protein [Oscillospiraceae bacterium]
MELRRVTGVFESEELADLAAGRIRRRVRGIRRITVHPHGRSVPPARGRVRFTMLPANLRMMNYATDVLYSEIAESSTPEPLQRRCAELTVICNDEAEHEVSAVMLALGAYGMQRRDVKIDK